MTAEQLTVQAGQLSEAGQYAEAISLVQQALAIHERVLGPAHPATASSLSDLAALYRATGAYAEAEPLFQRALAIHEQVLGPEHLDTAGHFSNRALSRQDLSTRLRKALSE